MEWQGYDRNLLLHKYLSSEFHLESEILEHANYVNEVENNCSNWTEDDWERSQSEYEKLLEEYQKNYDSYSQEERDAINKAIGRYTGLLVRQGIEETGKLLKDFGERLPSLLEGFMSAFDENHTE